MIHYKMVGDFMVILFSFQMRKQMKGKQIFFFFFLHWLSASIMRFWKTERTDMAKIPLGECVSWLWLQVSPRLTFCRPLSQTVEAVLCFLSSDLRFVSGRADGCGDVVSFVLLMASFVSLSLLRLDCLSE